MSVRSLLFAALNSHFQFRDAPDAERWILSVGAALVLMLLLHALAFDRAVAGVMAHAALGLAWAAFHAVPAFLDAIGRYRKENSAVTRSAVAALPATQPKAAAKEPPGRKKRRPPARSRKSRFKNMNEQNEGSSKRPSDAPAKEKVKFYSPLPFFLELDMDPYDLYLQLLPHVLRPEQLRQNGFPTAGRCSPSEGSPAPPEDRRSPFERVPDNPDERRCCRCGEKFFVTADGSYEAPDRCRYHRGKTTAYNGIPGAGPYACCNGDYLSEGCATHVYHVSAQTFLDSEFVRTREKRHQTKKQSCTVYALDCEMCYTTRGIEVAKVGLVGLDGLTVFDSYVLPENRVLDYNTAYSGVTANSLRNVTTTLVDVQTFLLKLIGRSTILVGHGLENDLRALRIVHETVVDTSVLFPHVYGRRYKRSLKSLAADYLDKTIQDGDNGHNCIEDARTCMELVLFRVREDSQARRLQQKKAHICDKNGNLVAKCGSRSCRRNGKKSPPRDSNFYVGQLVPEQDPCCCRE